MRNSGSPLFQKRYYEVIVALLRDHTCHNDQWEFMVSMWADVLGVDNANFKRDKFLSAIKQQSITDPQP